LIVSNYLLPTEFEYLTGLARCLLFFIGDLASWLPGREEGQLDTPHPHGGAFGCRGEIFCREKVALAFRKLGGYYLIFDGFRFLSSPISPKQDGQRKSPSS
jgi:hypothetical protein